MMRLLSLLFVTISTTLWGQLALATPSPKEAAVQTPMAEVGPSDFRLTYPAPGDPEVVTVPRFYLDVLPVTNERYLDFVKANPKWQKGKLAAVYADARYLHNWDSALSFDPVFSQQPVTHVSWYAAKAYCQWLGKRLPTELEWEMAAAADGTRKDAREDKEFQRGILSWYAKPAHKGLPEVGQNPANLWGVKDILSLVWEWVYDYNSTMVSGDSREADSGEVLKFCGVGALTASDESDYASFMRYAFRSSLEASFTTSSLGFRCASDGKPTSSP